jgi:DnaJ-class molecular chaperone
MPDLDNYCDECDGTGQELPDCEGCEGKGRIKNADGEWEDCPECLNQKCPICNGDGSV